MDTVRDLAGNVDRAVFGRAMSMRRFAAFDIDGTIFRWQLYHELFDAFVDEHLIAEADAVQVFEARESWRKRETDYEAYEMTLVGVMRNAVVGVEETRFNQIADSILQLKGNRVYRYTLDLLHELKARGYVIIAISGSYQQLVDRFAKLHDIDIAVGREHTIVDGRLSSKSTDIFGRKNEVLRELVASNGLSWEGSYAVGDSGGDISLLESVENPIAFNPDERLRQTAMKNGWPIVIERKNQTYRLEQGHDGTYLLA